MNLQNVILNCKNYIDSDEEIFIVFAQKDGNDFNSNNEAKIEKVSVSELETKNLDEIAKLHCPEFEYFLEVYIIQEIIDEIPDLKDDSKKVERVIYYAKYDA